MNRTEYRHARRLIRDNGAYALRWMGVWARHDMEHLRDVSRETDWLRERATWAANPRGTSAGNIVRLTTWII